MFENKTDVDRHVEFCLKRVQSESERNLRSFAFAKLYFNIGEYDLSKRYVSNYLIAKPKSAEAQLLLGKILEKMGRRESALEAYRVSLDIDPKQNSLVLKVCELLASNDVTLDAVRARFWTEQAQILDPQHPAVFNLRARLAAADSSGQGPDDVRKLFLTELEHRPTDVALRVRLLQHLLDHNQLADAYQHVSDIESKHLSIFADHLVWYETVATILLRYRNENSSNKTILTWEFWMLIIRVLDKLAGLCLDENVTNNKSLSECVKTVFNLDQMLTAVAENIITCTEKQFVQECLIHYRAQLCFHLATLVFKQAKKEQIKYKEAVKLAMPLLLFAYHASPVELQCVWLEHSQEPLRKLAQIWHRAASFRCSQAGHILRGLVRERRSSFSDRVNQLCAGAWRERTYKNIFITRDQQLKTKTSYFLTSPALSEITARLPDYTELQRYDEVAQLSHPGSLHHMIWLGLNKDPIQFRCSVFDGLQYSVRSLANCGAETLNILDVEAFLHCCVFCAQATIEESKHLIYYNQDKPVVLPAAISEPYGTLNQTKWYSSVYKVFKNESGSSLSDLRVTLIKGIEVIRCAGTHGLDAKLLVLLATTFAQRAKLLTRPNEIEATETRAELYWRTAIPLLEKLRNNQIIMNPTKRWFEYKGKEMTPTEINIYIEEGKLFSAQQLMKKKEHDKALQLLSSLKNPYASFYQAQIYKLLADEQMSHNKENVTSEMRSQHIILLSKSRDCFYLTLDRLREPSVDRKHPLNAELGTEIEKIERLLSRIDPDICVNRNECDGMSDENVSSVGSVGETGYSLLHHSTFHNGTNVTSTGGGAGVGPTTPRHSGLLESNRREARPSPERLDAQLRQMAATKDAAVAHILDQNKLVMEAHRTLVDEIRGFKDAVNGLTSSVNELRDIKKSVDELKLAVDDLQNMKEAVEQVYEIKKDLAELKKDTNKLKNNQINEEDLYALEEEYGVDYSINTPGATNFNSATLYPNFPQRIQGAAANTLYGAPGLYPNLYHMYPYGGLGLGQPAGLPFPDGHVPDFRPMPSLAQPAIQTNIFTAAKIPGESNIPFPKFDNANLSLNPLPTALLPPTTLPLPAPIPTTSSFISQVPTNKTPPVNVVITTSDPLPTTSANQPVLSVTIPPQHLKGNQPPKTQPHNYQIPLPVTTLPSFSNVPSPISSVPMPVSTQNLLSNVAPPVYSSLTVKSPGQSSKGLGLQIEKTLTQNFTPNSTLVDINTSDMNKTNVSEGSVPEEHDPCPDFKPIIPLPDEVLVTTGEEGERVIFCEHAKLYRFVEKEWKERGIGYIKLLQNDETGKVRLLMRRDQVHKICANHFIAPDMQLTQMQKNERAYIWAANDYADENMILEKFCIRFKTVDEGKKFVDAFETAKTLNKSISDEIEHAKEEIKLPQMKNLEPKAAKDSSISLGGFIFTSTPTFKPKIDAKPTTVPKPIEESPKSSPFSGFSFGTSKSNTNEFKPVQKLDIATTPTDSAVVSPKPVMKQQSVSEDHDDEEEFVPSTEFKPVVPLPDLVEIKTGEENCEILYEVKAKLLRFDSGAKEWKERGIGVMKILKDKTIRLLMRREQVHKVCCNHQLLKSIVFTHMPQNSRVLNWCAQDYSENVLKLEMFAIRFRTPELCEEFLQMIHKAQEMLDSSNNVSSAIVHSLGAGDGHSAGWGDKFKPKEGSWECSICYVSNSSDKNKCIACGTIRDVSINQEDSAQSPQKFKPSPALVIPTTKPKVGTWQCKVCFIHNDGKHNYCEACDSPKNDTVPKKDASIDLNASGPQFSFGSFSSPSNTTPTTTTTTTSGWGDLFKPKPGAWECKLCYILNDDSKPYCAACENPKDDTIPKKENQGIDLGIEQKFTFGIPPTKPAESIFGAKSQFTAGFTFGTNQLTSTTLAPTGFTFGSIPKPTITETTPLNLTAPSKTTFSFTLTKSTEPKKEEFVFGSPNKHEFEFKPRSPRKVSGGEGDAESDGAEIEEECDNIYFKPVIPLPDKVDVKTGEEDENVLYFHRAKLFRFIAGEWKERGIGDVKILEHPSSKKLRVLMRREQIHKICLNHVLAKDIEYKAKDDHTWLFTAADYSEGEISYQQFCLRFKNAEIATQFMDAVNTARNNTASNAAPEVAETKTNLEINHDPDLEIIYEVNVIPELQEKALKLQLPKNFYAYLQKAPCKGCIGCNDEDFVFSVQNPKPEATSTVATKPNLPETNAFIAKSNIFSSGSFFSGNNTNTSEFETPRSTVSSSNSTFSFGTPNISFTTSNIFSTPTQSPDTFSGAFGTAKNDAPTLTSLLTKSQTTSSQIGTTITEHKSPLAPSKLNLFTSSTNLFGTTTSQSNIFSGVPSQTDVNIFGNKPSTPQMLSSNKESTIFGGGTSIFSGAKSETSKTEPLSIFGKSDSTLTTTANIFGGINTSSVFGNNFSFTQPEKSNIFGNTITSFGGIAAQANKEPSPVVLTCDSGLSFAALAAENQSFTANKEEQTETEPFSFAGAGSLVFAGQKSKTDSERDKSMNKTTEAEEEVEDENYDPHYEPIVPLPDAIDVKTGEEDETILFNERAKLFRYSADTKEWKERGVGQIKILHHPVKDTYRLLMRREQVHKLVLNQLLSSDLDLQAMQTSERAWCWAGYNHSEESIELEKLALRFKTAEIADKFRTSFLACQDHLRSKSDAVVTFADEDETEQDQDQDQDQDDYGSEDSDENRTIMFCKRCTLSYKADEVSEWQVLGMGVIKMLYDSEMYGGRIEVTDDTGEQLSNTIIAINTVMKVDENSCIWRSMEWSLEAPAPRILRAHFSSAAAAQEMFYNYEEALQYAQHSEIVDNLPE